jgi:hypothetical protein
MDGLGAPVDRIVGLVHGFFLVFYSINRGEQATASKIVSFTVTFGSRRLACPPRLSVFARIG